MRPSRFQEDLSTKLLKEEWLQRDRRRARTPDRAAQGLPPKITDPAVTSKVVAPLQSLDEEGP